MTWNDSKWLNMTQNDSKWLKMTQNDSKLFKMTWNDSKRLKMTSCDLLKQTVWSQKVLCIDLQYNVPFLSVHRILRTIIIFHCSHSPSAVDNELSPNGIRQGLLYIWKENSILPFSTGERKPGLSFSNWFSSWKLNFLTFPACF